MDTDFDKSNSLFSVSSVGVWLLRCVTYLLVLVFLLFMGRILFKGAPVAIGKATAFFSESPKTLHGFYDENGTYHRLTAEEFEEYQSQNPEAIMLAKDSADGIGGGIKGPLAGTVLLVLISAILALAVGIAGAIYLSEYSSQGRFMKTVRASVVSLSSVPPIVFGLFGLAFFCYFFPVITKSAPDDRSLKAWEIPEDMYPPEFADEGYRVDITDSAPETGTGKIFVSKNDAGLVFTVFNARSELVKQASQSEIEATRPTWVDIENDLATITALRDAAGPEVFYQKNRTREEEILISKLRPLLQLKRKLWLSFQGWEPSLIAAAFTLACMLLPIIITSCERALRSVPDGIRDATLGIGATHWQVIRKSVLPYALPGMLLASIAGIIRIAGETAPILFTGAVASGKLPWEDLQGEGIWKAGEFLQRETQAMPYHIYQLSAKTPTTDLSRSMQDGAVFVFMVIVMLLAGLSVLLKAKIRKNGIS